MFTGPNIINSNLIMYLDAASTKSISATTSIWIDRSGNGNHGTISTGEYVTASSNYLQNLGNTSSFFSISVNDSTSLNSAFSVTTGGWTIEEVIWTNSVIYPEADAGTSVSTGYGTASTGFDWNHGMLNTTFKFSMSNSTIGGASIYDDEISISVPSQYNYLSGWKLRTMIWNRSTNTVLLYINGILIGSGSTINVNGLSLYDGAGLVIGSLYGWKHYGRRGLFKVYNKVLTQSEITQNYDAIKSRYNLS